MMATKNILGIIKNLAIAWFGKFCSIWQPIFWIAWFDDQIVLGNDQKTFISKLMVEIEPSLMEQLNYFEQLNFFQAMTKTFQVMTEMFFQMATKTNFQGVINKFQ